MRWKNFGETTTVGGHKVFFSGKEDKHKNGVGFLVHKYIMNTVKIGNMEEFWKPPLGVCIHSFDFFAEISCFGIHTALVNNPYSYTKFNSSQT